MSDWRAAAEIGLLPRVCFHRFLEGLIGGDPEVLARDQAPIDAHGTVGPMKPRKPSSLTKFELSSL